MDAIKRNRYLLVVAIILLVSNLSILSIMWLNNQKDESLFRKHHYQNKKQGNLNDRIAIELNLTPMQLDTYKELKANHFKNMRMLRDSIHKNKLLIHNELIKKEPNIEYIHQLSDSIGSLNAEFEKLNYNHFFELKKTLTDEQLENFKNMMEKLGSGKDGHRHRYKNLKTE